MTLDLSTPTPLQYFAVLVRSDEQLPLLEAAASLAQDEYPELDVQQVLGDMDHLAARLRRRAAPEAPALDRLRALGQFFFGDLGFGGNVNDYYNPDNSHLHVVLRTRRGIPISLAVLWLELARGLNLRAEGVGFPGHFLVQVRLGEGRVVIDPFTGQSLSQDELRERIDELSPRQPFHPARDVPLALYLGAAEPRQILARMLRNLQDIHRSQQDWPRFVAVQDRLVTLLPSAWPEYRDRGLALAELGERRRARLDLSLYLREALDADDRQAMAERLADLGGRLA
ncbi:tetratricopeptide repeat protein [Ottowia sp.]|jgi:regulator of sirC expression with transglutaminase-like and TPR domain|uniref:SirB1 family protein n=1 Tax=Ottowia sp. TaxID=1898956 RepID=UPI0025D913D2|nr:tetratricopeptide repeat protein [Ottowia sp.]MBK6612681.1 tetratricopeptide repeat protein [Ottowia sp.]MBK6748190.1 tetratricopeptide repeat protein [Ottowia sp.]